MSWLNKSCLVLDKSWRAINVVPVHRAICMVFARGHVVVDSDYATYGFEEWMDRGVVDGRPVVATSATFDAPQIIVTSAVQRWFRTKVNLSKSTVCKRDDYRCQYCASLDAEILTKQGWKLHNQLLIGEQVLGYNLETGLTEWTTICRVNYTPPTNINLYENSIFSMRCTPDHKWVWEYGGKRFLAPFGSVPQKAKLIQAAPGPNGPGVGKLPFESLLDRDNAVDLVLKMTSAERQGFIYGMMVAEGNYHGTGNSSIQFAQNPGPVNDAFRLAAFLEGWAMSKGAKCSKNAATLRVTILRKDRRSRIEPVSSGVEVAWCPTTQLKTWVMRQKGQITITGNCGGQFPEFKLSLDHVVPKSQGGKLAWENVVAACFRCNVAKGGRTPRQAGMSLLAEPREPQWSPLFAKRVRDIPPDWEKFVR